MPDLQKSLASVPFGALIGGPMNAAIQAQANAAISTVEFIKTVGFDKDNKVTNITFKYGEGGSEQTLEVPLLTIVPIPFIRIDDMNINFKASMSQSNETEDVKSSSFASEAKISGSASYWFVKVNMSGSVSSKKDSTSTQNSKYAVEYTIDVNVHAVQDDMPAGMSKILNILAESIERQQEKVTPGPKK
jgi:hypothetical protein